MALINLLIITIILLINNDYKNVAIGHELQAEPFISSCEINTHWRRGGQEVGLMIKSWIQSIVATSGREVRETKVFIDEKRSRIMEVGNYSEGRLDGIAWKRYCHDCHDEEIIHEGWLYGMANRGEINGPNIVYLFPDLYTVLIGKFENGKMIQAKQGKVTAYRCRNKIMQIKYAKIKTKGSVSFSSDPINNKTVHGMPTIMDPYERKMVRIGNSKLAENSGDGIFAKKDLMAKEIILFYSGLLINEDTELYMDNMTILDREDVHKNLLTYDSNVDIDVPPYYSNIITYRATLGHKINHSFNPSTKFCYTEHPRFGSIRCIMSLRKIAKGEELAINYDYELGEHTPRWYRVLYHQKYGNIENRKKKKKKVDALNNLTQILGSL